MKAMPGSRRWRKSPRSTCRAGTAPTQARTNWNNRAGARLPWAPRARIYAAQGPGQRALEFAQRGWRRFLGAGFSVPPLKCAYQSPSVEGSLRDQRSTMADQEPSYSQTAPDQNDAAAPATDASAAANAET